MKNYIFLIIILILISPSEVVAEESLTEKDIQIEKELLQSIPLEDIELYWETIQKEYGAYFTELTNKDIRDLIKQDGSFSLKNMAKGLFHYLFYEIWIQSTLLSQLLLLAILHLLLQAIQHAFLHETVSKVANFIVYIVILYISLQSFHHVFTYTKDTIVMMNNFMIALLPILLSLLATSGQLLTAAFFHPTIIFLTHISGLLMTRLVLPFLYIGLLLTMVSHFNERFQATKLAHLFKHVSIGFISVFFTVFLTVLSIQGAVHTVQDGLLLKTTKFLSSNIIPIIGRTFTEATDTFLFAAQLLKNGVGIAGVVILVLIAIFPLIKIVIIAFLYKLAAALIQPLGNKEVSAMLQTVSQYMMFLFTCLLIVSFMFFISVVIMIVLSNIPLFLR